MRVNWRDHKDVTSFYFTRFPEDATAKELWIHFKQQGDVREVFIPRKRNKQGRRYGFVRYKGVRNVQQLQQHLDNMVFRGLKMNVNVPRYGRGTRKEDGNSAMVICGGGQQKYPKVSSEENTSQSRVWLKEAWVGRLKNLASFDNIEEDIWWDSGQNISPKYIGDDMVLLLGLTEENAGKLVNEEDEGWGDLFYSIEKWNPSLRPGFRLTWIQCWGIPLIIANIGEMVETDESLEDQRRLDVARILVKTQHGDDGCGGGHGRWRREITAREGKTASQACVSVRRIGGGLRG
uniref:RRM domain-containing protein n=1 Tax=Glycine max TaxID=3847 RepID=K7KKX5_SOYBN